jgi:cytochrome bd ubiquinol oxidase subunit I
MCVVAVGTTLSAYFILVANSWMQHPVGYAYNAAKHKHIDELSSFLAVLVNPAQLAGFPHVIAGCFLTAGALVAGVAMWHLMRRPATGEDAGATTAAFRSAVKVGTITPPRWRSPRWR